jgi:hypothetical protein
VRSKEMGSKELRSDFSGFSECSEFSEYSESYEHSDYKKTKA